MNDMPPARANAIANRSSETACMIAEVNGMFSIRFGPSSLRYFVRGVLSETLSGVCRFVVRPGSSKYSAKVLDGSSKTILAIGDLLLPVVNTIRF